MKNILVLLVATIALSCKAQTIDLYNNSNYTRSNGEYYKDINKYLNQFEGTWVLNSANYSMTFKFQKKIMHPRTRGNVNYYEDYLVGEYKYIENGVEKVNTLSNLNINHSEIFDYNVVSMTQRKNNSYPICNDCLPNEKRLAMIFNEPALENVPCLDGDLIIRRRDENGIEKLKIFLNINMFPCTPVNQLEEDPIFSIPSGQYFTLTRQP